MKKIILCAAAVSVCLNFTSVGAANIIEYHHDEEINMTVTPGSGKCGDNVDWDLDVDGTLTISGSGKMYEYEDFDKIPWFENNAQQAILNVKVEDGVTSISFGAFNKTSIVSLVLPDSIKEIGRFSVSSCPNLQYVVLSDNIETLPESALYYDRALTYVHMPKNLKAIESSFHWDESLNDLIIPIGVTEITERTFAECFSLKKLVIPPGVTVLKSGLLRQDNALNELYLPPALTTIEDTAISGCANIEKIIIPDGVTELGMSAIDWTDEKRSSSKPQIIYVPESVKAFGKWAILGGNIEIHGFAGSEAEKYANDNNIPFVAVTESMYNADEYLKVLNGQIEIVPEIPVQTLTAPEKSNTLDVMSTNGNINIKVNGDLIFFPDAQPFIDENNRTQIPIRAVAETLGAKVDWDGASRMATITKDNKVVTIAIDNANLLVGDKTIVMDTTAQIINDRTYIPVRFVGEALGMEVNWIE